MTPPIPTSAPAMMSIGRLDQPELLSDLTFDELRELPMAVQIGLDVTAYESHELD